MVARIGIAVVVALAGNPGTARAVTTLDWSVTDRLNGPSTIDEAAPARQLAVRVDIVGACPRDPVFELDGGQVTTTRAGRCSFDLPVLAPGEHAVTLTNDPGKPEVKFDLRDVLVVSAGDSVASGEGNPDGPGPTWQNTRCHRSLLSGAAQAALAVERGDRHSAITFVPLGCSGATIHEGLLAEYDGIQPNARKGPLRPQIDVIKELARPVDALLLSVGANDVHFGALVAFCYHVDDCADKRFDPDHPEREAPAGVKTAAEVEQSAFDELRKGYDELAGRLEAAKIPASKVVIVEYFDPLHDETGEVCKAALPDVTADEADWALRNVLAPLNAEVHAAAIRHGWQVVSGVATSFRRHGICAHGAQRWIRRPLESAIGQLRLSGTLHPNGDGHRATATLIAPVLATTLGLGAGSEGQIISQPGNEHHGRVPWPLLPVAAAAGAVLALLIRRAVT